MTVTYQPAMSEVLLARTGMTARVICGGPSTAAWSGELTFESRLPCVGEWLWANDDWWTVWRVSWRDGTAQLLCEPAVL